MKKNSVCVSFTPEEKNRNNNLLKLIEILIDTNHEIKISSDGFCTIVEANWKEPDTETGFEWVEEDEVVVPYKFVDLNSFEEYEKKLGEK